MLTEVSNHKICTHLAQASESISVTTKECEECKKGGARWVAPRLCMSCGNIGCCDSSPRRHATQHFVDTGHPVIVALPSKAYGDGAIFTKLMGSEKRE